MNERFNGAIRLRRLHGMRGYGIYSRIVELCASAPEKKLRYDLDDLAFDIRDEKSLIKSIVEDFGLFIIEGDSIEDVYARSPEALERERQALIHANRCAAARRAAQTRRERREAAQTEERPTEINATTNGNANGEEKSKEERARLPETTYGEVAPNSNSPFPATNPRDERADASQTAIAERFNRIKETWNDVFKGTHRTMRNTMPDEITWLNFRNSSQFYTDQDYRDAFVQARRDKKFAWQFRDAVKSKNMQRLLSDAEALAEQKKEEKETLDESAKEMIEYGEKMGWNWTRN